MDAVVCFFFFFKQKTAYEMRISDWSSDVCSSDLRLRPIRPIKNERTRRPHILQTIVSAGDELQFARHNGEGLRHFSCGPVVRTEDEDRVVVASRGAEISDQAADILIHSVNHRGMN